MEVIDKYGADALRFTLITGNAPGNDMRFYLGKSRGSQETLPIRFGMLQDLSMMNLPKENIDLGKKPENLTDADKWILSKVNTLAKDVTENLDKL